MHALNSHHSHPIHVLQRATLPTYHNVAIDARCSLHHLFQVIHTFGVLVLPGHIDCSVALHVWKHDISTTLAQQFYDPTTVTVISKYKVRRKKVF